VAAGSGMWGGRPQRYRRRRPLPAVIVLAVLAVIAAFVWIKVLGSDSSYGRAISCNNPSEPPPSAAGQPPTTLGQSQDSAALDRTVPMPPGQVLVRVMNASTQRGQAGEVTEALRQLGFAQVAAPDNDPLYLAAKTPGAELNCRAQIRYGQQGTAAARTLSLVEPCAQLVKDNRPDPTVDLALGKGFDNLRPKPESLRVLEQLTQWSIEHPEVQGGLQGNPQAAPQLDPEQLRAARDLRC
jgi:LytR cell envelope-related transcriptional attenuator